MIKFKSWISKQLAVAITTHSVVKLIVVVYVAVIIVSSSSSSGSSRSID